MFNSKMNYVTLTLSKILVVFSQITTNMNIFIEPLQKIFHLHLHQNKGAGFFHKILLI